MNRKLFSYYSFFFSQQDQHILLFHNYQAIHGEKPMYSFCSPGIGKTKLQTSKNLNLWHIVYKLSIFPCSNYVFFLRQLTNQNLPTMMKPGKVVRYIKKIRKI